MSEDITGIVFDYSKKVNNNRNTRSIFTHLVSEVQELEDEIIKIENGEEEGADGIAGESVDIMLCALDLIHHYNPHLTPEEVNRIAIKKCEKWLSKYKDTVY